MPIDRNLLTKAAKVYEAAEAVEGMKPKEVYESHKKCTPGEFGMHKEGGNKKADLYGAYMGGTNGATLGGLLGGGLGGVGGLAAGALSSRKGRRVGDTLRGGLKGLVGGGLLGAGTGAGLGASAAGQLPVRAIIDAAKRGNPLSADELRLRMSDGLNPATFAGLTTLGTLGGAAAGGALGGAANHALFDNKKEDNDTDKKKTEKKSAFAFGMRVKQSLEMPTLSSLGNVGVGGLAGAGLGGLYGLMNPGEEEDEHGRMRRRSRFGAALRGALGGGVLGAGGGALATYLANRPKPAVAAGGAYEYDINNPSAVDRSSHAPMPHKVETLA